MKIYIILNILCFTIGWLIREQYAKYKLTKYQKTAKAINSVLKDIIVLDIIKIEGLLYSYNFNSGEFLAQGKNTDELLDNLIKRYPEKIFTVKTSLWDQIK